MRTSLTSFACLLGLFAISIGVRSPNINRPLSTNYEWVTAHTLVTLQIWQEEGIITHRFRPIYTFPNPNDHYIKCPISGISDDAGHYYYVSYPPFAFIFPHLVFKTLGIYPNVLALEILNLALHFICAWLIYLILTTLHSRESSKNISAPGLVGASIYIFSPLTLWHHANVYFSDILVQVFFLVGIYFTYLFLFRDKGQSLYSAIGLFAAVFFMAYTEWIGFLFAGSLILITIISRKKHGLSNRLVLIVIAGALLSGLLTLFQYGSINGLEDFYNTAINRYTERSGHLGESQFYHLDAHLYLGNVYLRNYFPQFVILGFLGLLLLILKAKFRTLITLEENILLFLALLPVLLHHLILFEFTLVHDMALVKTCVFLSLLTGILFDRVQRHTLSQPGVAFKVVPYFVILSMLSLSVFLYHAHVIEPDGFSFEELGKEIKDAAKPEETVFFKTTRTLGDFLIQAPDNFVVAPQIQYYAGRCIQVVPSIEAAKEHLKTYNKSQGVIFTIENSRYQIENVEHFTLSPPVN